MRKKALTIMITILVAVLFGFSSYSIFFMMTSYQKMKAELASNVVTIRELGDNLLFVQSENTDLGKALREEQEKNGSLSKENQKINREVDTLTKLTTIDPELLKKYSKVFFLSENYEPKELEEIDPEYTTNKEKVLEFNAEALPFLEDILKEAKDDGIPLRIASAYRSFGTQSSLKANYTFIYGAGTANQFSADQGYSEHQLGTAVDFTTPTIVGAYPAFGTDPAFTWLKENAHNYGFILSYPKENSYYEYEPWHWRFVGVALAKKLHKNGKNFYDMDQRDIDEYLIKIFD